MPAPKRKSLGQLLDQVKAWNSANPVGTLVSFEEIRGRGETHRGKTASVADVVGDHTAIIFLEGKRGYVSLDHCTPVAEEGSTEVPAADQVKITVRHIVGGYQARALRLSVTASSSQGELMAAKAVCAKLNLDPEQLQRVEAGPGVAAAFTHPGQVVARLNASMARDDQEEAKS